MIYIYIHILYIYTETLYIYIYIYGNVFLIEVQRQLGRCGGKSTVCMLGRCGGRIYVKFTAMGKIFFLCVCVCVCVCVCILLSHGFSYGIFLAVSFSYVKIALTSPLSNSL